MLCHKNVQSEFVYLQLMVVTQVLKYKMLLWAYENVQVLNSFNKFPKKDPSFQTDTGRFRLEGLIRACLKYGEGSGYQI